MALVQVNFMSQSLMRTVPVNVILPLDKPVLPGMKAPEFKPFKTLYLLHGVLGSYIDWVSGSCIQRWAEERDLAVVMPSGDNMFYVDQPAGNNYYGEYVGKELVEFTRKMFPLSCRREDTFIAGLSMGGYGALRNGLKYSDTFGCIAGLSSALITEGIEKRTEDADGSFLEKRSYGEFIFGDLSKVKNSDKDLRWLAGKIAEEKKAFPRIYMAVGDKDMLTEKNREFAEYFRDLGADVTFEVGSGGHEWDFWNRYIKHVIDWLPLENVNAGISSGHLGE